MKSKRRLLGMILGLIVVAALIGCQRKVVSTEDTLSQAPEGPSSTSGTGDGAGWREEDIAGAGERDLDSAAEFTTGDGVLMNRERFINADIFFEFDSSTLSAEAESILRAKAEWMRRNPSLAIVIEGHCDNRGTTEYNLALGERRAESVKGFLIDLGIAETRIRTISYGEERPLARGDSEEAWAKNRRAHFEFD
ncbi:MAG: peptidoglycan-associated lipoprotein Pal [Desulfobacterales bacterium]|nr:peptidoglycan-associated lipoprotein Pal [Desulfobacterales bacterium]MDJ0886521.1 peptidoglycan-associated lipoprotein Pal [Desulfobacterales bacterium]